MSGKRKIKFLKISTFISMKRRIKEEKFKASNDTGIITYRLSDT